jgi:hypothetical protein
MTDPIAAAVANLAVFTQFPGMSASTSKGICPGGYWVTGWRVRPLRNRHSWSNQTSAKMLNIGVRQPEVSQCLPPNRS